jgi:hypothetical protein
MQPGRKGIPARHDSAVWVLFSGASLDEARIEVTPVVVGQVHVKHVSSIRL